MKKSVTVFAALGCMIAASTTVFAMEDVVKERMALMKSVGGSMGLTVKMVKGEIPYDGEKAAAALKKMSEVADKFPSLLKEGSDMTKVPVSEASPKIWENMDDFKSKMDALKVASLKSADAAKAGKGPLAGTLKALGGTCASCHQAYRVKKENK